VLTFYRRFETLVALALRLVIAAVILVALAATLLRNGIAGLT